MITKITMMGTQGERNKESNTGGRAERKKQKSGKTTGEHKAWARGGRANLGENEERTQGKKRKGRWSI